MPALRKAAHEFFAVQVAMGWNQAKAYREATHSDDKHASWREGCRRNRKDISERIAELRRNGEQQAAWTKYRLISYLESVLETRRRDWTRIRPSSRNASRRGTDGG